MTVSRIPLRRPMEGRDVDEEHRTATPLELFFDLVFVVAIAAGAAELHHGLAEGHLDAVVGFGFVFFAIWLAWLNYSWFASAYDTGDVGYRLLTFVIMTGSLVLAAGVPDLFADGQSVLVVGGYCVMRLGMVGLWLRAAAGHSARRRTCLTYAVGISLVQVFWVARLLVEGEQAILWTFLVGVVGELAVPFVAEARGQTPFHPEHMAERYGLFTIIVLGEVVLSTVMVLDGTLGHPSGQLLLLVAGALLVVFSLWWLYFKRDMSRLFEHGRLSSLLGVGYGHFLVFAAVAATGAGLAVAVDVVTHHGHASSAFAGLSVGVPIALFALALPAIHALEGLALHEAVPGVVVAVAVIGLPLLGLPLGFTVLGQGLVLTAAVVEHVVVAQRVAA